MRALYTRNHYGSPFSMEIDTCDLVRVTIGKQEIYLYIVISSIRCAHQNIYIFGCVNCNYYRSNFLLRSDTRLHLKVTLKPQRKKRRFERIFYHCFGLGCVKTFPFQFYADKDALSERTLLHIACV